MSPRSNNRAILVGLVLVLATIVLIVALKPKQPILPGSTKLTSDTASTTQATTTDSWNLYKDPSGGVSFRYPESFGTTYIGAPDWPPQIMIMESQFSCNEAGKPTERAGETKKASIGGREYCVTEEVGGAAGSTYTQYAYSFMHGDKLVIMTFTVRMPQCGNYDEPKRMECAAEQKLFDADKLVDQIATTLSIS